MLQSVDRHVEDKQHATKTRQKLKANKKYCFNLSQWLFILIYYVQKLQSLPKFVGTVIHYRLRITDLDDVKKACA